MLTDARTLPNQTLVETDIAIVGAGPAGISLAYVFANRATQVCLVEAGGRELDPAVQALYDGKNLGIEYPLVGSRLRYFGGSSNHWGGFCRPLDPIDFERRDWVPYSGWPFGFEELAPYFPAANEMVEIAPAHFVDKAHWEQATGETLPDPVTGRMQVSYLHYSPPTYFGARYGPALERAHNVQVLLNANLVKIALGATGRAVTHLAVRTLDGRAIRVQAKRYVLATGGLENARLLLLSNDVMSEGVGNQNDLVGRFFMEHPHLPGFGDTVIADPKRLPKIYYERLWVAKHAVKAAFNPSESFLRERRLLNATFTYGLAAEEYTAENASASETAVLHTDMLKAARPFLTNGNGTDSQAGSGHLGYWLGMGCACEQAPNPDSRVTLASERDALGLPQIQLDWRLSQEDRRSVVEHMKSLAMEFGALGIGRLMKRFADKAAWPDVVLGGNHHMGTTRMHDDPKQGVVDRNSRVHGVSNLYIAGSSVFPTSGAANPTLTLVALTLRLAEHLRNTL